MDKDKKPVAEPVLDEENPEWTAEDFKRALRGDDMPDFIKKAFKVIRTREQN